MKILTVIILLVSLGSAAILQAEISVESEALQASFFLDRIQDLIGNSHTALIDNTTNNTFEANYDLTKDVLTVTSIYSLILKDNQTSNVRVNLQFFYPKDFGQRNLIENIKKSRADSKSKQDFTEERLSTYGDNSGDNSIISTVLTLLRTTLEPAIVTVIHVIIQGVLSNVVTDAVDRLYLGQMSA